MYLNVYNVYLVTTILVCSYVIIIYPYEMCYTIWDKYAIELCVYTSLPHYIQYTYETHYRHHNPWDHYIIYEKIHSVYYILTFIYIHISLIELVNHETPSWGL